MTAPVPPVITAHGDGASERVIVRWRQVDTATDYKLYVTEAGGTRGLEDDIDWTEVDSRGWLRGYTSILAGVITVDVTSLNSILEESAPSNTVQVILRGGASIGPDEDQTPALNQVSRWLNTQ